MLAEDGISRVADITSTTRTTKTTVTTTTQTTVTTVTTTVKPKTTLNTATILPTIEECKDSPNGWKDKDGDDCNTYSQHGYCKPNGDYGDRWDLSTTYQDWVKNKGGPDASTACCKCGGGERSRVPDPNWQAPITTTSACPSIRRFGEGIPSTRADLWNKNPKKRLNLLQSFGKSDTMTRAGCAAACLAFSGAQCQAFQFHILNNVCELMKKGSEAGDFKNDNWQLFDILEGGCREEATTTTTKTTLTVTTVTTTTITTTTVTTITTTTTTTNPCLSCVAQYSPVCGVDDNTYENPCYARCYGITEFSVGLCKPAADKCPACARSFEPVCAKGTTYYNPCFSRCAGVSNYDLRLCTSDEYMAARREELQSDKSCTELGLGLTSARHPTTCGFSGSGSMCYTAEMKWKDARALCEQQGARMCSVDELLSGLTQESSLQQQSCAADGFEVWTGDACPGGKYSLKTEGLGSMSESKYVTCSRFGKFVARAHCCADEFTTTVTSTTVTTTSATTTTTQTTTTATSSTATTTTRKLPICEALGLVPSAAAPFVCAFRSMGGQCFAKRVLAFAESMCSSMGARLCSASELATDLNVVETCETSQAGNSQYWSSNVCSGGNTVVDAKSAATCVAGGTDFSAGVQCCGDIPTTSTTSVTTTTTTTTTATTTTTLPHFPYCTANRIGKSGAGKTPVGREGDTVKIDYSKICGFSKIYDVCKTDGRDDGSRLSNSQASTVCQSVGARLCTVDELHANVAALTGCNLDKTWVWTGEKCFAGHFVTVGRGGDWHTTVRCVDSNSNAHMRCCEDAKQIDVTAPTATTASAGATTQPTQQRTEATDAPAATDTPATEAPATEAPATEAPATEAPVTEVPVTEAPATDAPATEAPATETPTTDTALPGRNWSPLTCAQIGATVVQLEGETCGISKLNKVCYHKQTYSFDTAQSTCNAIGARLCMESELLRGVAMNSGCQYGKKGFVWTQDTCPGGRKIVQGAQRYQEIFDPQCVSSGPGDKFGVIRCCADVGKQPVAGEGTDNAASTGATAGTQKATTEGPITPTSKYDWTQDCSCTITVSEVCGYNGKTYTNPCFAFCDRQFAFTPGVCKEGKTYCPTNIMGKFSAPAKQRLTRTSKATIAKKKVGSAEDCALECEKFDENLCHSFEYQPSKGNCQLKIKDSSEVTAKKSNKWLLYNRIAYCAEVGFLDDQAVGRMTNDQRQTRPLPGAAP